MLELTTKPVIKIFMRELKQKAACFKEVFLVTPFLEFHDPHFVRNWQDLLSCLRDAQVKVYLITGRRRSQIHNHLIGLFCGEFISEQLIIINNLHAKIYLAVGKERRSSMGLLTSANLTEAAVIHNLEVSLFMQPPLSDVDLDLLEKMRNLLLIMKMKIRKPILKLGTYHKIHAITQNYNSFSGVVR